MATIILASLYNSTFCRICGNENSDGVYIYDKENDMELKTVINRYLPIKVEDDGKLPRTICPGCHIQIASTAQFFNLLAEGQARLRQLWDQEVAIQSSLEREKKLFSETLDHNPKISLVEGEDHHENDFLIKIFSEEPFFGPEHEMTLLVEGLDKPKRKRGRPRKQKVPDETVEILEENLLDADTNILEDLSKDDNTVSDEKDELSGRNKRRRKPPQRLLEAVAGQELERILYEEGAIDILDELPLSPVESVVKDDFEVKRENNYAEEIIGHMQTADGDKAEPIVSQSSNRMYRRARRRSSRFVCDFCHQTFNDRTRWLRHRLTHKTLRFQCSEASCLGTFTSHAKLSAHQSMAGHSGEELVDLENLTKELQSFLCGICGLLTCSTQELATHTLEEHPVKKADVAGSNNSKLKCNLCPRTFNHTSSLVYHKESFHNNGVRFACSKCPKTFAHKQLLQRHQMVHSDSRPFVCGKCGVGFKTKSNLLNHKVVHTGEKKFSCDICGQLFAHKTSLNLHVIWHQGIRPYKCPLCDKCFTQNGNLSEHLRIHYGEKPYSCMHCGKTFTTSSQRKLHIKRHTGERPWKCQYCDKQFLHKDTWKTHERRHTGEKPFSCTYCQRGFAEHWSLKKHVRLHTGEKPYKCDVCGKDFADCSNLTKHKKVHGVQTPFSGVETVETDNNSALQQIVYVYNQDGIEEQAEIPDCLTAVAENSLPDNEEFPVHLDLPDGRTALLLSVDNESNMVHARTSDGWTIMLQLQHPPNIQDEETINQIREAIVAAKPAQTGEEDPHIDLEELSLIQGD